MQPKSNFIKAHYDWLVALVGLLALAGAVMVLLPELGTSADDAAAARQTRIKSMTPAHNAVPALDLSVAKNAQRAAKTPPVLNAVNPKQGSFLASERRLFCKPGDAKTASCGRPIPVGAEACPFCGAKQVLVAKVNLDTDNDGLPNDWETKYGLNPTDASDAEKDADGDGFTNAEEFAAKTNPKDRESHPDYLDYLAVKGGLKQVTLPFWFKAASPIPGGHRYTFQNLKSRTAYDKTFTPKSGEEIGTTGWTAGAYQVAAEDRVISGSKTGAKRKVDVSTVEITRKSDGRKLTLRVNDRKVAVDTQAELVWDRCGGKNFTVKEGDEIDLNGRKYRIMSLKAGAKSGCSVTVEDVATKKQKTLEST